MQCPTCRTPIADGSRFCAQCGATVTPDAEGARPTTAEIPHDALESDATVAVPRAATPSGLGVGGGSGGASGGPSGASGPPPSPSSSAGGRGTRTNLSSSDTLDGSAFPPGTLLAGRYRIVGLLGRGGMGEVYRADDLTLGQSVALKFLPESVSQHSDRLQRFYGEARLAREVSHPNVCRVYDIGRVEGPDPSRARTFLSMEFVDGDDLASLLRRIGRLPEEKAVEIARQLCAGLAALHDRGVIHRDLKPANVLIDGRGRVRLTDFGLAALAHELGGGELRSGTPAYMAPEQIAGDAVTVRSDIYSLGLVLYEIFTGKRAFDAESLQAYRKLHHEETPASISTLVSGVDPLVERVIHRCLEKDPALRPSSAIAVATALPGGDPLAAALAAGETPSPEMVAASGGQGGLRPVVAMACAALVLAGVFVDARFGVKQKMYANVPLDKPTAVLQDRARQLVTDLGYAARPAGWAQGYATDAAVLRYAEKDSSRTRWDDLLQRYPAAGFYWYRQSPALLVPLDRMSSVTPRDPPFTRTDMVLVELDPRGGLLDFRAVPAETSVPAPEAEPDWGPLFAAAGLDPEAMEPAEPAWNPSVFVDERRAWVGTFPGAWGDEVRVEAGAVGGRPVSFAVRGAWSESEPTADDANRSDRAQQLIVLLLLVPVLGIGGYLAVRNTRLGRGDRRGALRLAGGLFGCALLQHVLTGDHVPDANVEFIGLLVNAGFGLVLAALTWALYLALEPYVRRIWPSTLISWSRLLAGRVRDPLVGQAILIGGILFVLSTMLSALAARLTVWLGHPPPRLESFTWSTLEGPRFVLGNMFGQVSDAVFSPVFFLVLLVILRVVLRRTWIAMTVFTFVIAGLAMGGTYPPLVGAIVGVLIGVSWVVVLVRFGLLPFALNFFFSGLFQALPITLQLDKPYAGASLAGLAVVVGLTLYGAYTALAGRSLLQDELGLAPAPRRGGRAA